MVKKPPGCFLGWAFLSDLLDERVDEFLHEYETKGYDFLLMAHFRDSRWWIWNHLFYNIEWTTKSHRSIKYSVKFRTELRKYDNRIIAFNFVDEIKPDLSTDNSIGRCLLL